MKAVLVRTGKYRKESVIGAPIQPTQIIDSIASLETLL
jgi:ribonucleotide monophosphatase NagD (HAD superfamily)